MFEHLHSFSLFRKHSFKHVSYRVFPKQKTIIFSLNPYPQLCFSIEMLEELLVFLKHMKELVEHQKRIHSVHIQYLVINGVLPKIFCLGGDLNYFLESINGNDRTKLLKYAHLCAEVVFQWYDTAGILEDVTTIGYCRGAALGGGFEALLASDVVIAKSDVRLGLPESLFGLFPGMGAVTLLTQRIGLNPTIQILLNGRIFTADECRDLGIIDHSFQSQRRLKPLFDWISTDQEKYSTNFAIRSLKRKFYPLQRHDIMEMVTFWADCAFANSEKNLEKMKSLVQKQEAKLAKHHFSISMANAALNLEAKIVKFFDQFTKH